MCGQRADDESHNIHVEEAPELRNTQSAHGLTELGGVEPGVVDEDADASEFGSHRRDHGLDLLLIRDVTGMCRGAPSGSADSLSCLLDGWPIDIDQDRVCSPLGQRLPEGLAETPAAAGDHRDPTGKIGVSHDPDAPNGMLAARSPGAA